MKLWQKMMIGLLLGVLTGVLLNPSGPLHYDGSAAASRYLFPLGDIFTRLIRLVVVPLVFISMVSGINAMSDFGEGRRIGLKAAFVFLATSVLAVIVGLACASALKPGIHIQPGQLQGLESQPSPPANFFTPAALLSNIIPVNIVEALSGNDRMLQVVLLSIFVGFAIRSAGEPAKPLVTLCHAGTSVVFQMVGAVMELAPYGVFCVIAPVISLQGLRIIGDIGALVATVACALLLEYLLFGLMIAFWGRMSPLSFYRKIVGVQSFAFSIRSSKAALPAAMRTLTERMGVSQTTTSLVLPLGTSISMAGAAAYLGVCSVFVAQVYDLHLSLPQWGVLVLTATLGSIGAAGIPSGSIMMMGMVFSSIGLPVGGIAVILAVEPILDMLRSTINIMGDTVVTLLVDKSEGTFNEGMYRDASL